MRYRIILTCVALIISGPSARPEDPKADEVKKLQGEWQAVEVEVNGKKVGNNDKSVKKMNVIIKDDQMTVKSPDATTAGRKKTFKLDPSKLPKEIDITSLDGQEKDQTAACIYKLEKDRLTICIPYSTNDPTVRPKDFKTGADDGLMVLVLERQPSK